MGNNILIGVTGSIAAYKACDLASLLKKLGHNVKIIMSPNAARFVTPLALETVSGNKVYQHAFEDNDHATEHIALARWADLVCIVPASAAAISRFAYGLADDLLTTQLLAFEGPILVAPAMNHSMFKSFQIQAAIAILKERGVQIIEPAFGELACGEVGIGKLADIAKIAESIQIALQNSGSNQAETFLSGKQVVITGGATRAHLDPVRFISNASSGKMAIALAESARRAGAHVNLILGHYDRSLPLPSSVDTHFIHTNEDLLKTVEALLPRVDYLFSAAAPTDFKVSEMAPQKIKKSGRESLNLVLVPDIDVIDSIAKHSQRPKTVVGFAAETEHLIENAQKKLVEKNLDYIIANRLGIEGQGIGSDHNEVTLISRSGRLQHFPKVPKTLLADQILEWIHADRNNHRRDSQDHLHA